MNCTNCGLQLPVGARACPNCGTRVPTPYDAAGASQYDATFVSSPNPYDPPSGAEAIPPYNSTVPASQSSVDMAGLARPVPMPATGYGSNPYGVPPLDPYSTPPPPTLYNVSANPYEVSAPPPPPPPRRNNQLGLIIGIIVLILILIGAGIGVFVFLRSNGTATTSTPPPSTTAPFTPTPTAIPATATATALQNLYTQSTSGTPILNDPLTAGDNYAWDNSVDSVGNTCAFKGGAYHSVAVAQPPSLNTCFAGATNFNNFAFQIQVTIIKGHNGGILFRGDNNSQNGYQFRMNSDGTYKLDSASVDSSGSFNLKPLLSGSSPAIKQGLNQPNVVTVIAQGSDLVFYINGQYVDSTQDTTYTKGQIGIYTDSDTGAVEATFSHAQVWKL